MSSAKIATQVSHCTIEFILKNQNSKEFEEWYNNGKTQIKTILGGKQALLEGLEDNYISIRDLGLTEIKSNSLTCICLGLMTRNEIKNNSKFKRLQLL